MMFQRIAARLIARAKRTPYFHLPGYMNRYWLVPYATASTYEGAGLAGCGPVSFWRRPFAWVCQRLDIAIRVHEILRSDDARAYHDHPWPFVSVVLRGQYAECRPCFVDGIYQGGTVTVRRAGSIAFRRAQDWHRLIVDDHATCTTLFVSFRKRQKWGFLVAPCHKISYNDYFQQYGNEDE